MSRVKHLFAVVLAALMLCLLMLVNPAFVQLTEVSFCEDGTRTCPR